MTTSLISVLMAAYNAEAYVEAAIESLLAQSWNRLELIVVDDGSSDSTGDRLAAMARRDPRIRILTNATNLGLAASLNRAIDAARGDLLARMDADDIALPDRLRQQMVAFAADPRLVLLGSNVRQISASGHPDDITDLPIDDWTIRCVSLSLNPFAHPTVMMRIGPFREAGLRYNVGFETTQDWELWLRLMQYGRVANLPEPLVEQRVHTSSISARRRQQQRNNSLRIQQAYAARFLGEAAWNRDRFAFMNEVFYSDRRGAELAGQDLVAACQVALDLLAVVERRYPRAEGAGYRRFVVDRCLRMGLVPPSRRGAAGLSLRLLISYPAATLHALLRVAAKQLYGSTKRRTRPCAA